MRCLILNTKNVQIYKCYLHVFWFLKSLKNNFSCQLEFWFCFSKLIFGQIFCVLSPNITNIIGKFLFCFHIFTQQTGNPSSSQMKLFYTVVSPCLPLVSRV